MVFNTASRDVEALTTTDPLYERATLADLLAEVEELPAQQRSVVLGIAAGYSYDEMAARLGITVKRVDNQLAAARASLRS